MNNNIGPSPLNFDSSYSLNGNSFFEITNLLQITVESIFLRESIENKKEFIGQFVEENCEEFFNIYNEIRKENLI
jgi:hypothetical protein